MTGRSVGSDTGQRRWARNLRNCNENLVGSGPGQCHPEEIMENVTELLVGTEPGQRRPAGNVTGVENEVKNILKWKICY